VLEAGRRQRNQPAPPHVVFEALTDPDRHPTRPWLLLLDDEQSPQLIDAEEPNFLVWSSLWRKRSDARVRFDLASDGAAGTRLRWTLLVEEPLQDPPLLGHLRKRLNERVDLVDARYRSWRHVVRIFTQAAQSGSLLSPADVEDLRCLPVADAFHHFAHDVSVSRLHAKGVPQYLATFASQNLPTLRAIFPGCQL
jgi:hypothetical protein